MRNQRGTVIIWTTLMIVLLLVMVGMGLDTGQLVYTRSMGQAAVDAAALSAVSGLPSRDLATIQNRAIAYNSKNDYTNSKNVAITGNNVTLIEYDFATGNMKQAASISSANAVRVALEQNNPYDAGAANTPISTPVFLTPLLRILGVAPGNAPATKNISVSAVSVITTKPSIPIALWSSMCGANGTQKNDVLIKMQHPSQKDDDGSENACWTTFLDCSSGASDIKALFKTADECSGSSPGSVEIGTPICQNRGQVNTALGTAEDFFMKDHPDGWWLVPVINGGGNCAAKDPTKIVNWAKIYPTEVKKNGNPKYIKANVVCDPTLSDQLIDTNLCFQHRLVRDKASGM